MPYTNHAVREISVAGYIAPISTGTSEQLTAAIDLSKLRKVVFFHMAGVLGSSATSTFVVKGATTSGGSYTSISGTSVTLAKASSEDGLINLVECDVASVNALGLGYLFVKGSLTNDVNSATAVLALGFYARQQPGSANDAATTVKGRTVI